VAKVVTVAQSQLQRAKPKACEVAWVLPREHSAAREGAAVVAGICVMLPRKGKGHSRRSTRSTSREKIIKGQGSRVKGQGSADPEAGLERELGNFFRGKNALKC
jgi:hypothetical protein